MRVRAFAVGLAIAIVPVGLAARGGWGDTELDLPEGRWIDVFTGRPAPRRLADIFATHPVALLLQEDS